MKSFVLSDESLLGNFLQFDDMLVQIVKVRINDVLVTPTGGSCKEIILPISKKDIVWKIRTPVHCFWQRSTFSNARKILTGKNVVSLDSFRKGASFSLKHGYISSSLLKYDDVTLEILNVNDSHVQCNPMTEVLCPTPMEIPIVDVVWQHVSVVYCCYQQRSYSCVYRQ